MRALTTTVACSVLLLGTVACQDPEDPWVSLELSLAEDETTAGAPVAYTAELVSEAGARAAAEVTLASDLEPDLLYDGSELTATRQGSHVIVATAVEGADVFTAEAALEVLAGQLAALDLVLDPPSTPAGEPVTYAITGADAHGNPVTVVDAEVTLEDGLEWEVEEIVGVTVGDYAVTARAGGVTDVETLEITPGPVAEVDLVIAPGTIVAGASAQWSAAFWDPYGNVVEEAQATVSVDSADVTLAGADLTSTVAGEFVVRIDVDEGYFPWDTEWLVVEPDEAVSIELTLDTAVPEVEDPVDATALILDQYGNVSDESWTLSVTAEPGSDAGTVAISGHTMTFTADGEFSAVGTVDSNGVFDVVGPFLVDSFGPVITITNPPRGAWSTSTSDVVTGTITDAWSGVVAATCNGDPLTLAGDGSFTYPIDYEFGYTLIETLATDGDGNDESDRRSVLTGAFVPEGDGVPAGIVARLNEASLDTLEVLGEDLIDNTDVAGMIPDPVYQDESETCVFGYCWTWYSIELHVDNPTLGASDLELDPRASGAIETSATIYDVVVPWSADGVLSEIPYSGSGSITADSVTISMNLWPSVSGGVIAIAVTDVAVSSVNFDFDFDSWLYDVATFFGIDIDSMVRDYVYDAIESAVTDEVPPLLEDTLQDLELATSFDVLGTTYDLEAVPDSIAVDEDGLTLGLETHVTPQVWGASTTGEGSLYAGYTGPTYGSTPGMVLSLSDDFLCQALFAFWGGGLLTQTFAAADLGLDASDLAFISPNMTDPYIVVDGLLPPVVLPGTGAALLDLQLGDLGVAIYGDDPADPANEVLGFSMGLEAEVDLTVTANATLAATITVDDSWFDVTYPTFPQGLGVAMEDVLDMLIPVLTPLLTDAIGEIPIPEISGFTLDNVAIEVAGAEDGYVNLGGDLVSN